MDSEDSLQDLVRCVSCDTPNPILHCDICHIPLCKSCVGEHLSDESKEHKVVPFKDRGHNPKCLKHSTQLCDLYCEECNNPICLECVSSGKHLGHKQTSISKKLETKKNELQKDLHELQNSIYPTYEKFASNIPVEKANLNKNSKNLTAAIDKHGENAHREIDTAMEKLKSDLNDFDTNNLAVLNRQEEAIKSSISEINQIIDKLKELQNCNDVMRVSAYKSRNAEFNRKPSKLCLPRFTPLMIQKEQFGFLSISTEHKMYTKATHGYSMDSSGYEPYPPDRPLIDVPRIITEINTCTDYERKRTDLRCVSCLSDNEVWTCGTDNIMRLFSIKGKLLKSIKTESGNKPGDIAVVRSGELVYTDLNEKSVNIVINNKRIERLMFLWNWGPLNVCSTYSGDLLVVMISENKEETRVVRYSGSTEKQIIQNNDEGKPLYSSELGPKYISENRNQDICVADNKACAIVVVNLAGKHRFTYTGPESTYKRRFYPRGIATDSQSRILTADHYSQCIHILDQDGQFLRYIENYGDDEWPWGLSVDSRDNLFVTDFKKGTVRKIQYCMEATAIMK